MNPRKKCYLPERKKRSLPEIFDGQLFNLQAYACPPETIQLFLNLKEKVLAAGEQLAGDPQEDYLFPFLPVLPNKFPQYREVNKKMFSRRFAFNLIAKCPYNDDPLNLKPYYIIGVKQTSLKLLTDVPRHMINFSELIALALQTPPIKTIYAHSGCYPASPDKEGRGIWINLKNGRTGSFRKSQKNIPLTIAEAKITKIT